MARSPVTVNEYALREDLSLHSLAHYIETTFTVNIVSVRV